MAFCSKCGTETNGKVCPICGALMPPAVPTAPSAEVPSAPVPEAMIGSASASEYSAPFTSETEVLAAPAAPPQPTYTAQPVAPPQPMYTAAPVAPPPPTYMADPAAPVQPAYAPPAYNAAPVDDFVQPYAATYTPPAKAEPQQNKGLIITGLVLGAVGSLLALIISELPFIGWVIGIPGAVLAIVGFVKARPKTGLPLAALIVACVGFVLSTAMCIVWIEEEAYYADDFYDYYDDYDDYDYYDGYDYYDYF